MNLSKPTLKRILIIVIFVDFIVSPALIIHFAFDKPIPSSATTINVRTTSFDGPKKVIDAGLPVRLKIPKINIDTGLDYVGLTPQGELGVPAGPSNAAWYNLGPRPGQKGDAVIDGHFGYKNHIPAVFDNLHALQTGDNIYVEDEQGVMTTFVVRELRTYARNENDSNVFVADDGGTHLNLITCQGIWNQSQKSYSKRLVVFADKAT